MASPAVILGTIVVRRFTQQILHNIECIKISRLESEFFQHKDVQQELQRGVEKNSLSNVQKKVSNRLMENKNDNKDKINLENLEWTTDSKIKETAERLGIFEKPPINSDLNKGSGIDKIPKPKTKAKTVYYKDFIKSRNDN